MRVETRSSSFAYAIDEEAERATCAQRIFSQRKKRGDGAVDNPKAQGQSGEVESIIALWCK